MDVGLAAVARARRFRDGIFHRGDNDAAVDGLFARHRIGDLQQFQPLCTDGRHSSLLVLSCRAPLIGTAISTLTTWPAKRSKSERRTNGRSMPGEEISSR